MPDKLIIQQIVLGAVAIHDGKVLILQRSGQETVFPGLWELPSGKKEPLEDSETAIIREVREETGLTVKVLMPVAVFDYQVEKPDVIRDSTQVNFLVEAVGDDPEVRLTDEHQAHAWIQGDEIQDYETSSETKAVIIKAFELMRRLKS